MQIKRFTIRKINEKKNEKGPDYYLEALKDDGHRFEPPVYMGVCWLKEYSGKKSMSCSLNEESAQYNRKGYTIHSDSKVEETPVEPTKKIDYPENTIKAEEIPF
jgi:hypothetical protein